MRPLELLFVVALVFYSIVIWLHKLNKKLDPWMVCMFGAGLLADVSGTVFLCVAVASRWVWNAHTISGLAALVIMACHFAWAVLSIRREGKWKTYFDQFSIYAWVIWMFAFLSGIPR